MLDISTNTALFSLLGTNYGGDGITTFAVPNLDEAIAHLKSKGVSIVSSPSQFSEDGLTGGAISACVRDPDGNLIELEQILS